MHLKNFSRRSLLRGLGAGTVLLGGISRTLYAQTRIPRAAFFFFANGSHPAWAPKDPEGTTITLTPHLAPLEPIKKDLVICRNMILERGSGNSHKGTSFSALGAGAPTSFDQTLADYTKATVPLASLEIAIGYTDGGGGMIPGLSQRDGNFLPGARNPVVAYQRIADRVTTGAPPPQSTGPTMTTPAGAEAALAARKSLLDFLADDVKVFSARLGGAEKMRAEGYIDSLRTLEMNIGSTMGDIKPTAGCAKIPSPDATLMGDVHVNDMPKVNHLFLDTIAMGFACGVTRVASAMWGGGQSDESVQINDISMGDWHSVSHGDPAGPAGAQMTKLQAWFASEFLYFCQKLKSYADGPLSLLDNTVAVLSTQNGTSTQVAFAKMDHDKHNTPFILAGSCGGAWTTGKIIECNNRAHNDVYTRIAQAFGMKVTSVGAAAWSQGPMPGLMS